jgi:hypothetical protein
MQPVKARHGVGLMLAALIAACCAGETGFDTPMPDGGGSATGGTTSTGAAATTGGTPAAGGHGGQPVPGCDLAQPCSVGQECCAGSCVDLSSDQLNCGACHQPCALTHATTECAGGTCLLSFCDPGYADCNGDPSDGCEAALRTDATDCGACGRRCSDGRCVDGVCPLHCPPGTGDCDGLPTNGCETNLKGDVNNCGQCGQVCALANAIATCSNSQCAIKLCQNLWGDCDGQAANGCESDILADPHNCTGCGRACGDGQVCKDGVCALAGG